MASYVPAKKNTAFVTYVGLVSAASGTVLQANPTLTEGDVKVAIDDGAPANTSTLPTVDADFTKRVKLSLSSDEMNGDNITVIFSDASGSEWCDLILNIQTASKQIEDIEENGMSTAQETKLDELHKISGLDSNNPMTVTPASRSAGTVSQVISGDGETTTTVTRQ